MGDARYRRIKSNLSEALRLLAMPAQIEEIRDLEIILSFNVSSVPALLIEDKVVFEYGDIPSPEQLELMIKEAASEEATS